LSALHNEIGYESLRFYGPFQPQHIEKLQITRTINDHAYVMVSGMLSEEQGAACIGQNMEEEPIVIRQLDEQGQSVRRLFHGIVTRLSVHCIRGVYTFELEAASHSYQMDIQIKKRSYQDIHRTYDDLVTTMIRKYKYGDAIDTVTNNTKLGTFVLQYEETDWAFLKRLAARFGSVLVPEVTAASPKVFFGMPAGKLYKLERDVSYQVRRTFHELETGKPGKRAGSYVTYVFESLQYYALGDSIALPIGSGKELVVVRAVTRMKDGLLLTRYDLQAEQDIRYARYENDQATGIALTGSVLQVQQDLVQLQLDIDPKQDPAKACWFPVATRYAAEEHSGWYDMPEVGARVELYLPTSREHEAYVTDSRQHRQGQGEPDVKVWRHAQGSGVDMSEQELTLSTSGGFSITLHEGNGITVSSPGDVRIQGGHVKLDAGQELSLTAGSALYLTGGASSMVIDGETDIKAPVVDQEGTVKAPVFVMDLPPVPEPPLMNIKDYEAAQAAGSSNNTANTPTAKITNPVDQKQADGLLSTESKLLGAIPMMGAVAGALVGAVVGVVAGAAVGGSIGAAVSTSLLASAAVPVRSTGTSQAGGEGAKGGLHPLKYLAGLFMQGLISQYEHEKAKDAYYSKWLLGKVFTSARHIASSGGLRELIQNMVIESNAIAHAYQQVPPELRQRWKANYDRNMAEQPKPKQEEPRSWLTMLGEAQIQQAEAQLAMGKQIAEVGVQTGEEIWSGVKKTGNSFAEIGIDFWNGLEVRANKSLDSPYDFGNWLTVGAFDAVGAIVEGYKTRADMRNQSPYDYVNWLSSGMADTLKGAFNPDDPLSKEHWMNSFGVFTSVAGARGLVPKGGGPTLPKVNAKNPLPKIEERANQDVNKWNNGTERAGEPKPRLPSDEELLNAVTEWSNMQKKLAPSKRKLDKFNTAVVVYDSRTDKYYYGMNKGVQLSGDTQNPLLFGGQGQKGLLPENSKNKYALGNCAEVDGVNQALNQGSKISDLYLFTVETTPSAFGKAKVACENCTLTFKGSVADALTGWYKGGE